MITEFGFLQDSSWHSPPVHHYDTTSKFLEEYVRRFDEMLEIQAWFWYLSTGEDYDPHDTNFLTLPAGGFTPNGDKWRELAKQRQG